MFFNAKKDETGAVVLFKHNCTYHGLDVHLSKKALTALKVVLDANAKNVSPEINERDQHTLWRRGMVRVTPDGEVLATQIGLLTAALAEAGGLIVVGRSTTKEKA